MGLKISFARTLLCVTSEVSLSFFTEYLGRQSMFSGIAKHFRRGRQEDAHEFLRYLIEALQRSCLTDLGIKTDDKMAETTWVHDLFGGKLRSRVKCRSCGHPSDTFDSILDLSIDVNGVHTLKESLYKFVKLDVLKGADRYKCEKCEQFVVADKGFTLHEAPTVLTIHLKRFTPFGRKIVNPVRYEECLDMQPYMSEGQVRSILLILYLR
jgi:ubiquitin carboxyl-terminal hydrolase 36/42